MYINNWIRPVTVALMILSVSVTAYAGALISDPVEKNASPAKERPTPIGTAVTGAGNVTPIVSSTDTTQRLSCWQYGKLIFEQAAIPPKDKMANIQILQNPDSGEKMIFFDFRTAFCLIK